MSLSHLLTLETDELEIARVLGSVSHGPLQRPEVLMIHLNVVLAVLGDGVLLTEATGAVLQRSEHGGAHIDIVGQGLGHATQSPSQ